MSRPRVAVIGAGVMGASAACALAQRGCETLLFDQFAPGHEHGSSHGPSRAIRMAYYEGAGYVPLLARAYEMWRALEKRIGKQVFHRSGIFEAGPADGAFVPGIVRTAKEHNLPLTPIDGIALKQRFPWLRLPKDFNGVIEENAGLLLADHAWRAFYQCAEEDGAAFHWNETAQHITLAPDAVTLTTDKGAYVVDKLVLTPGPWASRLFSALGLTAPCPIAPYKKIHVWTAPGDDQFLETNGGMTFMVETKGGELFYGFPAIDSLGVKVGRHTGGAAQSELTAADDDYPEEEAATLQFLTEFAPDLAGDIRQRQTCLYEMSPDGDFVIDYAREDSRIVYAIGFSGHGFKFAPVIGEILADMAMDKPQPMAADFLSAQRFSIA